jgi:DNA-binding NarL/FixJ family response regulator
VRPASPAAWRTIVADRSPEQRTLLRLALGRDPGFDVVAEARSGHEALELTTHCDAHLLLADAGLPGLDGPALVAAVRAARPSCTCVLVSSLPERELVAVGRAAGASGVVSRATPASQLAAHVRQLAAAVDVAAGAVASLTVTPDPASPRAARRFVDEVLQDLGYDDVLDTVQLLVTEVATNAVVHARTGAEVVVVLLPDAVRVEVVDVDDSFPVRRRPGPDQPGGRGFELVERLSRAWGIDMLDVGKRTWFEVASPA